jgi:hypothetical protein
MYDFCCFLTCVSLLLGCAVALELTEFIFFTVIAQLIHGRDCDVVALVSVRRIYEGDYNGVCFVYSVVDWD